MILLAALIVTRAPELAYPADATGWYEQGNTLTAGGDYTGAITAYDRAIAISPLYYEAWNGKAERLQPRAGDLVNALEASNRSLELNPGNMSSAGSTGGRSCTASPSGLRI